ncbi:MAG: hypothetical protein RIT14_2910 [Pseudomonadota bacterium]
MWTLLLDHMLSNFLPFGNLTVKHEDGTRRRYGDGSGPALGITLRRGATRQLVLNPDMALGSSYTDGLLQIDGDDLPGLLALVVQADMQGPAAWWQGIARAARRAARMAQTLNDQVQARRNVAHHYDLTGDLYAAFLDADRQYSCAYFRSPDDTLDRAQAQKKAHVAAKLCLRPGMRVLDIGCGWGGMAITLARDHGARVTGITLSSEQLAYAQARVAAEGLSDRIDLRLCDYRAITGSFDRIVSVGMFEHVGTAQYQAYFSLIRRLLTPDGIALVHTIGRSAPPAGTNPWIARNIFPGGYVPAMSEVTRAIEKAGLWMADIESLRLHYALTLQHWRARFEAAQTHLPPHLDDRFRRMWRFYLTASEMSFRHGRQAVFQYQLSRRIDAVPITRDYLYRGDAQAGAAPAATPPAASATASDAASTAASTLAAAQ